jgi:hypothetical protein
MESEMRDPSDGDDEEEQEEEAEQPSGEDVQDEDDLNSRVECRSQHARKRPRRR